jgi:superfamily I DNA and/or RNA helicase
MYVVDFSATYTTRTAVVKDAKNELDDALSQLYGSKGGGGKGKASGRVVQGKARGKLRQQVTQLRKEIRQRERSAVRRLIASCNVVCSTTVGAAGLWRMKDEAMDTNPALFDLVVIDEAAQGIEATCWIPVLMGRRLVLAGDHLQLPPTIKSDKVSVILVSASSGLGNVDHSS